MHMADALIAPAVAATMYVASSGAAAISVNKVRLEQDFKKIPLMGVMSAFVFAGQMINFTIPGTGSSGHLCGGLLLSILLGPYAGFLSMISILAIQALLFADGGILALGSNVWNMAFYACFIGYVLIYKPLMKKNMNKGRIMLVSILASVVSLQLGAFSVTLQTLASGITELSFGQFLMFMQPIHLAIGAVEGVITGAVVIFIQSTRPELLTKEKVENKLGLKQVIAILAVLVVVIGGGLSLVASGNP
ncbi:MAG: energy-coupling factor ABC transporter permease, partial [Mobilitalea sp.]